MSVKQATKKICLFGDFGVGKSSLVARYVNHTFSDKYLTTVGVSIKTRIIDVSESVSMKLIIWDIAGEETLSSVTERYLKGANGLLMVADGLRPPTVDASLSLLREAQGLLGEVPHVSLINKADLPEFSTLHPHDASAIENRLVDGHIYTSAKTGLNVEFAFAQLASMLI